MRPFPTGPVPRRWRRAAVSTATVAGLLASGTAAYTVRPGDTLSEVASRLGVTVDALAQANGIADPDRVVAGRTLSVPGQGGAQGHLVRPGETLSGVARRYGVAQSALARVNGIAEPDRVVAGMRLRLPGAAGDLSDPAAGALGSPGVRAPTASVSRAQVGDLIERVAGDYGWNPAIVKALAWQESGWNQSVVSSANAIGIMQVLPSTGRFVGSRLVGRELDLTDAEDNVVAGVAFLDYLYDLTGGDIRLTLGGYYQGLASIRRNGQYDDTRRYIDNVLALRERFR